MGGVLTLPGAQAAFGDDGLRPLTMSSREIAELTGKRHDNVLADIRNMLTELYGEARIPEFSGKIAPQGRGRPSTVFFLPKRETLILVSGYNLQMRAKIIDRWQELEAQVAQAAPPAYTIPQTYHEALRLAADEAEAQDFLK